MIKIGITGSLASGKTTASRILSHKRGPLFSADIEVQKLYKSKNFKLLLIKKFGFKNKNNIKQSVKKFIIKNPKNLEKLEKIIHPQVRKKMQKFTSQNKNKKILFYEIPLLIESKLMKFFDVLIFIKSNKQLRFKRFKGKRGDKKLFNLLNKKQMSEKNKIKFCDYVVVNEKNLKVLKENLLSIMVRYE